MTVDTEVLGKMVRQLEIDFELSVMFDRSIERLKAMNFVFLEWEYKDFRMADDQIAPLRAHGARKIYSKSTRDAAPIVYIRPDIALWLLDNGVHTQTHFVRHPVMAYSQCAIEFFSDRDAVMFRLAWSDRL